MDNRQNNGKAASARFLKWLGEEAEAWKQDGIISQEQQTHILSRYSSPDSLKRAEDSRNTRFIAIISILGSILLGLGIILFFAHNWKYIAVPIKLGIIFSLVTAVYAAGYWLVFEKKAYTGIGNALILLGVLFFGAGIWLIAQIFNINAHYPNGILFWSLGGVAVSLVTRLKPVVILSIILMTIWTVVEQTGFEQQNYLFIIIMLAVVFPLVYLERSKLGIIAGVVSVSVWFGIFNHIWQLDIVTYSRFAYFAGGMLVFFVFLYSYSSFQTLALKRPDFEFPLRIIALLGIFITLYSFTFRGMEDSVIKNGSIILPPADALLVLLVVAAALSYMLVLNLMRNKYSRPAIYETAALVLFVLLTALSLYVPLSRSNGIFIYTILFNIIFLSLVISILAVGFKERRAVFVNMALLFFVVDVVTRYFDYMWNFLPRSVFFIAGGLLLIFGGILLEKRRRKIIGELG